MTRSRWFLLALGLVVIGVAIAAFWWLQRPADDDQLVAPTASDAATATAEAADATAEQGAAELSLSLSVRMPPDFDDGVPMREIEGEGAADFERNLASVDYAMGDVPNSAGFFGHVEGDLSVVYQGPRFILTFPLMADVLEGDLDWMSYNLSDFADPVAQGAGIGQLREIGLADPRLGFALASSGVGGEPDADGGIPIDLGQASGAVEPEAQPAIQALQELGLQEIVLVAEVDSEGLLRSYSYELAYSPRGPETGGRKVRLSVTVELTEVGVEETIEVPPEPAVQSYLEYLEG